MASGRKRGASERQLVSQEKKVVTAWDSETSAKSSHADDEDDPAVPIAITAQCTQPNGGIHKGNQLALATSEVTSLSYYPCYKCRSKSCSRRSPSCHEPIPSDTAYPGAHKKKLASSCRSNQTERNLIPCLQYTQLVPSRNYVISLPAPIAHPWILPFPHYSTSDHRYYQLAPEDNQEAYSDGSNENDYGQAGMGQPECQICTSGMVECVFMPCGHARTCQSCSSRLLNKPCPFCRQLIYFILRIYL